MEKISKVEIWRAALDRLLGHAANPNQGPQAVGRNLRIELV
jgi:hypothetical protein